MHRKTLALLLFTAACVDAEQPLGESEADSTVNSSKTNRWYSSTIKYYADPSLSSQHWKAVWRALHDTYNAVTSVDFVAGCSGTDETHPPTCIPDVTGSAPYVMYADAAISTGGRTMTASELHATTNQLSEVAPTRAALRNGREIRTAENGFCTGSSSSTCTATGQAHDDYIVVFPTLVTGTGSDWGPEPLDLRTPLHETGHVLGMIHEQRRPDATDHLNIYTCCVSSNMLSSIQPYADDTATVLGKWDWDSIMLYSPGIESSGTPSPSCYNFLVKDAGVGFTPSGTMPKASCAPLQDGQTLSGNLVTPTTQSGRDINKAHVLSPEDINTVFQMYPRELGTDEANDHFGAAMVAGDFDDDGYTDLAVGVPHERYKSETNESGMVYVFKGTFTGLEPWSLIHTGVEFSEFGASLAAVDVDRDGIMDLVIGAPGTALGSGAVWLYNGSQHGFTSGRQVYRTSSIGDRFGDKVHAIRKSSSIVDFAVGMPSKDLVEVYEPSGSFISLVTTKVRTINGPTNTQFGAALGAGEVDGDTYHDLLIGAPGGRKAYVVHGTSSGPGSSITTISDPGTASGSQFGAAVIAATLQGGGDDVIVGAPGADSGSGRAYRFNHGTQAVKDTLLPADFGQNPYLIQNGHFGATLAAGKLYSTGTYDHVVVGMPDATISGQIGLYHITSGSLEHGNVYESLLPSGTHTHFGASLALGNFDGKGPVDLAIGEPERSGTATNTGEAWILHGRTSGAPSYTADDSVTTHDPENNTTMLTQGGNLLNYRR